MSYHYIFLSVDVGELWIIPPCYNFEIEDDHNQCLLIYVNSYVASYILLFRGLTSQTDL